MSTRTLAEGLGRTPYSNEDDLEHLWAPWRMAYIQGEQSEDGCFFCRKLAEEDRDAENYLLHRSKLAFVIMNIFPYSNGHVMVSPRRHTGNLLDLKEDETTELMRLTQRSVQVLEDTLKPHGFNVGLNLGEAAGAGVAEHLHIHIVPRWSGDTNFMPVLAEVKIIPDHLRHTYQTLEQAFKKGDS